MKIAVLLKAPWVPGSVDMTEYLRVLQSMGHQSVMVCLDRSFGPPGFDVEAASQQTLEDPAFYRRLKLDACIAFTWLKDHKIIEAMKAAGVRVLLRGDTDGQISVRHFPAPHFRVRMSAARGVRQRLAAVKHWTQRYLFEYRLEDRDRVLALASADAIVLETAEAAQNVVHFLRKQRQLDIASRLHVAPHFVSKDFLEAEVPVQRNPSVVSIGRWEDVQKNAPLLCRTIELHLARYPQTSFWIIGPEAGSKEFIRLTTKYPQVKFLGPQTPAQISKLLAHSQILLSSSRWEGSPLVANEALAVGATVVGTPITAFIDIATRGYGTISRRHSATSLAEALDTETKTWIAGKRDPRAIAAYWRPQLSSRVVISNLLNLLLNRQQSHVKPTNTAKQIELISA